MSEKTRKYLKLWFPELNSAQLSILENLIEKIRKDPTYEP